MHPGNVKRNAPNDAEAPDTIDSKADAQRDIQCAKRILDYARIEGDQLKIDLARDSLDHLLDRYRVTFVTGNNQGGPSCS